MSSDVPNSPTSTSFTGTFSPAATAANTAANARTRDAPSPTTSSSGPKLETNKDQRLIVVSNRLPVTISKDDNGEYHFKVCQSFKTMCAIFWK